MASLTTRSTALLCIGLALASLSDAHAQAAATAEPQRVEVVGRSPMPGLGVDRELLPYNAQVIGRGALDQAQAENLSDHMLRRVPGLQVSDIQGSPFQGDLSFRGYRASGLLGAAQGLSVFLDGVRINEAFGDVVNWDLVPEFALQSMTLQPGANPAFGLNTLGGAIALSTVDGRSAPGLQGSLGAGSFGRQRADVALGQDHGNGWHSFFGASTFDEDGWRDFSPSRVNQLFAKVGRADAGSAWSVSLLGGRSTLVGNGLLPSLTFDEGERFPDLYAADRNAVYTHPDRTENELGQLALHAEQALPGGLKANALAYVRVSVRNTVNGDAADDAPEGAEENAAFNTTGTRQRAWGLAASVAGQTGAHQWQAGISLDGSRVRYEQLEQEARFDATRGTIAGDEPAELSARVEGDTLTMGAYATDTWALTPTTHLTGTLQLNRARVRNQLDTVDDDTGELEQQPRESFTYSSVNPALGLAHRLAEGLTVYGNATRNTRVPTAIELGCADPEEPCRLPVGLQSDPYLKPVRATSLEVGARWRPAPEHRVELALFRTDNRDDILFSSVSTTSQLGYFRNFDRTRHQGLELSWAGRQGAWDGSASVSTLKATYESEGTLRQGERNVLVQPGTRIAGLPRWGVKAGVDWRVAPQWSVGADAQWVDSRGVQGNEDDRLEDDDDTPTSLRIPGYALLHLRLAWQATEGVQLVARVQNALGREFESYGALGSTVFDAAGRFTGTEADALFVAPGSPRSLFVGLRLNY